MKLVIPSILYCCFLLTIGACNQSSPAVHSDLGIPKVDSNQVVQPISQKVNLAFNKKKVQDWFVYTESGLNMRAEATLDAKKLATIPYGTKLKILAFPEEEKIEIEGFVGGMAKVEVHGKEGYMYAPFLSRFPPPKDTTDIALYIQHIESTSNQKPRIYKDRMDEDGYVQDSEGIILPTDDFQEAFLIAKLIYAIPSPLHLPIQRTEEKVIVKNPNKSEMDWTDELSVIFKDQQIDRIAYYTRSEGYGRTISITKEKDGILVSETHIAD